MRIPTEDEIEAAKAWVAELERRRAGASCAQIGKHDMQSTGGANCGCEFTYSDAEGEHVIHGQCSVPVNVCTRCGVCDFGDNEEAREVRRKCAEERDEYRHADSR